MPKKPTGSKDNTATIGKTVDDAIVAIERDTLLPKLPSGESSVVAR